MGLPPHRATAYHYRPGMYPLPRSYRNPLSSAGQPPRAAVPDVQRSNAVYTKTAYALARFLTSNCQTVSERAMFAARRDGDQALELPR